MFWSSVLRSGNANDWAGIEVAIDDGLAVLPRGDGRLYLLNQTSGRIWTDWRLGRSAADIASRLAERFDIDPAQALVDVRRSIAEWREAGLLGQAPAADARALPAKSTPRVAGRQPTLPATAQCYRLGRLSFALDYRDTAVERLMHPPLRHLELSGQARAVTRLVVEADRRGFVLRSGQDALCRHRYAGEFTIQALREINIMAARALNPVLVLHAAAFGRDGHSIVLPGPGGCGKSTLAAAMALAGWDYLGDDMVAVLPHSHRLSPLPTSLNLKPGSLAPLAALPGRLGDVHPVDAGPHRYRFLPPPGGPAQDRQWRITAMVFPRYVESGRTRIERISGTSVLGGLAESATAFLQQHGQRAMTGLLHWLGALPAYRLEYGDLDEARSCLDRILQENSKQKGLEER